MKPDAPNEFGTALGVGTGIILVTLLATLLSPPTVTIPGQRGLNREQVQISFAGVAPLVLAEAASTEYVTCDTELTTGISRCTLSAPAPVVRVTVVVKTALAPVCTRRTPLVRIDGETRLLALVKIERHEDFAHCLYRVPLSNRARFDPP